MQACRQSYKPMLAIYANKKGCHLKQVNHLVTTSDKEWCQTALFNVTNEARQMIIWPTRLCMNS